MEKLSIWILYPFQEKNVKGLRNYKQNTVAEYFNLQNKNSHRAKSDAIICGNILTKLFLLLKTKNQEKVFLLKTTKFLQRNLRFVQLYKILFLKEKVILI